uniref:Uncharacterized protein n=1 Tax=Corethron hystrix TaxID=216773 RepID=A0A7S1BX42_9STRA
MNSRIFVSVPFYCSQISQIIPLSIAASLTTASGERKADVTPKLIEKSASTSYRNVLSLDNFTAHETFFISFNLLLGANITTSCILSDEKGCIGVIDSVKEAAIAVIDRDASDGVVALGSKFVADSLGMVEMQFNGIRYFIFSVLVDVLGMADGDTVEVARKKYIEAIKNAADDQSLIEYIADAMEPYDVLNGRSGYHEIFRQAQSSSIGNENTFSDKAIFNHDDVLNTEFEHTFNTTNVEDLLDHDKFHSNELKQISKSSDMKNEMSIDTGIKSSEKVPSLPIKPRQITPLLPLRSVGIILLAIVFSLFVMIGFVNKIRRRFPKNNSNILLERNLSLTEAGVNEILTISRKNLGNESDDDVQE